MAFWLDQGRDCMRAGRAAVFMTRGRRGGASSGRWRPTLIKAIESTPLRSSTRLLAELEAETLGAESALASHRRSVGPRGSESNIVRSRLSSSPARRNSCSSAIPPIPRRPRKPSRPPSPSRRSKARAASSFCAALSLAKLYQSTGRPVDAHAVLAPALEGFAPTPEMPEIAEAQALLVAIEAGAHVRHE